VLDLGSGGGIHVILSARRVGEAGISVEPTHAVADGMHSAIIRARTRT
jgi:hypothetical protein